MNTNKPHNKAIPIVFSFDNNYTIPAAVAFYSLLNKAAKNVFYEMFVLHSDISEENQDLLQNIIKRTNNASLNFILKFGGKHEKLKVQLLWCKICVNRAESTNQK